MKETCFKLHPRFETVIGAFPSLFSGKEGKYCHEVLLSMKRRGITFSMMKINDCMYWFWQDTFLRNRSFFEALW